MLTLTNFLRLLFLIMLFVAIFWFSDDKTYEPLLALLGAIGALAGSFVVDKQRGNMTVRKVEADKNLTIENKKGGNVDVKRAKSGEDMTITNS